MTTFKLSRMDYFKNVVATKLLLYISFTMAFVGLDVRFEGVTSWMDFFLTTALKCVPPGALLVAYFKDKDKIDANIRKTFSWKGIKSWFTKKRHNRRGNKREF